MECCCNHKGVNAKKKQLDLKKLTPILEKYKGLSGSLISILQEVQEVYNYLPMEALNYIAEEMGIKPAKIHGVATFYTQFRLDPVGKFVIMLCQGTACHVNGSKAIEEAICDELGIKEGETTQDNLFTLENVACLGCCSLSPVMMINGETYGNLTPDKARKIINEIKEKEGKGV
ncbi:NADH-quinone oxidoreductase subunit NuoE [Paramaledivibacter caminithermalis]|uniref:NADH dehydrogenase subunit E n=1 Tax=Paramaledivibacter caminithermalis (strain DSM 15212 / CIP 107654 / DViRD3) TaxID=1121301 RepID=A0A1M6SR30_PARC5|nr:NADH-quinone oxidoreductase subunit NuoE [Paramaledivibacter caminithermalis]SHK47100.1 NADH dehydrogenase subunit E [Paramaledivibacter caminithermalis DSM 15212]